jgi:hypothetical protein
MVLLLLKWFFPPCRQTLPPVFYGTVVKDVSFDSAQPAPLRASDETRRKTVNSATGQAVSLACV